jgi:ATP-dependent RNA helicase DDX3X
MTFLGSGKTAAFLIPVLSKLFGKALKLKAPRAKPGLERGYQAQPLVLVLGPTRELVWQIFDEARKFCYRSRMRPWYKPPSRPSFFLVGFWGLMGSVVYGGAEWAPQRTELQKGCDILVATPGRLLDAMMKNCIGLDRVR